MTQHQRLAVKAETAARMLDLPVAEFLRLVAEKALPPPRRIGDHQRWDVAQIEATLRGTAQRPEPFEL